MTKRGSSHFQNKEPLLENLFSKLRFKKVDKHIPDKSRVLDLGCGYNSHLLQKLAPRIKKGVGIDIHVTTNNLPGNLKLLKSDINRKLPIKASSQDIVVALATIEHVNNPSFLLQEINRVLRKGGRVILTTPSNQAKPILEFLAFKLHLVSEEEIKDHKQYFKIDTLPALLKDCGFRNIKTKSFQFGLNLLAVATK